MVTAAAARPLIGELLSQMAGVEQSPYLNSQTDSFCCPYFCAGALELGVVFTDIDTLPYPK